MEFVLGLVIGGILTYLWQDSVADWTKIDRLVKKAVGAQSTPPDPDPDPDNDIIEYVGLPIPEGYLLFSKGDRYGVYAKKRNNQGMVTTRKATLQEAFDEAETLNQRYRLGPFSKKKEEESRE